MHLLHSDLARFDGFGFWQRNGQDPLVDICGNLRRINRWSELVDLPEIVWANLPIDQFTSNLDRFPTTQNDQLAAINGNFKASFSTPGISARMT